MKISELLEKLGELQGLHGDIEVVCWALDSEDKGMLAAPEPTFAQLCEDSVIVL